VKYHFKTKQGIKNFTGEDAAAMRGIDPDCAQRDLFDAIAKGDFPKWRVAVQIMPEKEAETDPINPFGLTKVWPHKDYPLIPSIGSARGRSRDPSIVSIITWAMTTTRRLEIFSAY
jgi:catalase